jgi:hypothetical protein
MPDSASGTSEDCYAAIVTALRTPAGVTNTQSGNLPQEFQIALVQALPEPGAETECDRVLTFVEVICGNLESWYWAEGAGGTPLSEYAHNGLEPYGQLSDFSFLLARQSDLAVVGSRP